MDKRTLSIGASHRKLPYNGEMGAGRGRTRRTQTSDLGWGDELLQDQESQEEKDERRAQEIRDSVEACRDSGTFSTPLLDYLRTHADELAKYD